MQQNFSSRRLKKGQLFNHINCQLYSQ
uniref:Uncharacterized protein n=1 Tax=Anguilla anguilla TaxID=7936 RepID=A0A0E9VHX0_ANGAN